MRPLLPAGRSPERLRERAPRQAERVAHALAGERAVRETGQPHVLARRRAEHVPGPGAIDTRLAHQAEHGVARPERNGDAAFANQSGADETARVVAGPRDHFRRGKPVALLPVRRQRADDGRGRRDRGQLHGEPLRRGIHGGWPPLARPEVHEVRAGRVAGIHRRLSAGQQRGEERADEVNAIGRGVGGRIRLRKLPDLRGREALERARAGPLRQRLAAADRGLDFRALGRRARIHPDGCRRPRENSADLLDEGPRGVQPGQRGRALRVQVDAAVLLGRSRNGREPAEVEAASREPRHHDVERFGPQQRRRRGGGRIVARQHAVSRVVVRERLVEQERGLERHAAAGPFGFEHDRRKALGAGIEPEIERHGGSLPSFLARLRLRPLPLRLARWHCDSARPTRSRGIRLPAPVRPG